MKRSQWLLLVAVLSLPAQLFAQRADDGRAGMPPVHQDSTRPSREALFVRRAVQSSYTAMVVAVPFALYMIQQDGPASENLLKTGSLSYLAVATWGAARRRSPNCSVGTRLWRAAGGALAGMAATGMLWHLATDGDAYYAHHLDDDRGRITAASFVVGVPLGAAAALYNCR